MFKAKFKSNIVWGAFVFYLKPCRALPMKIFTFMKSHLLFYKVN